MSRYKFGGARLKYERQADATINTNKAGAATASVQRYGLTFTQNTLRPGGNAAALANGIALIADLNLHAAKMITNQFGMNGPCTPANWAANIRLNNVAAWSGWPGMDTLFTTIGTILDGQVDPYIVADLLPSGQFRMNGGHVTNAALDPIYGTAGTRPNATKARSWTSLHSDSAKRWTDAHMSDFALTQQQILLRYPQITHAMLINEQKGNYSPAENQEEIAGNGIANNHNYTAQAALHNLMHQLALDITGVGAGKRPTLCKIIGPYPVIEGSGIDGLAAADPTWPAYTKSRDTGPVFPNRQRTFFEQVFALIDAAKRHGIVVIDDKIFGTCNIESVWNAVNQAGKAWDLFAQYQLGIETVRTVTGYNNDDIWLAEQYYMKVKDHVNVPSDQEQGARTCELLYRNHLAGVKQGFWWGGEQASGGLNEGSLITSTRVAGGGQPYPMYHAQKMWSDLVPPGTLTYPVANSAPKKVGVLCTATKTIIWNRTGQRQIVRLDGGYLPLDPYQFMAV